MAPGGVVAHSSSWTPAAYEPHEVLLIRLAGPRQRDQKQRVSLLRFCRNGAACPQVQTVNSQNPSGMAMNLVELMAGQRCPGQRARLRP